MVPKQLKKSNESLGDDQESLMASSYLEHQGEIKNDKSILRQPIDTGVRGVRDLMKAVVGGTEELQELLLNECTIIYECKICRNLFRSLANFISHKRIYCINRFSYFTGATTKQEKEFFEQNDVGFKSDMINCNKNIDLCETKVWLTNNSIVPNSIKTEKNNCLKPTRRIKISPIKTTRKCDIAKIADGLNKKARKANLKESDDSDKSPDLPERVLMKRSKQQNELDGRSGSEFFESSREVMARLGTCNEAVLQENGKFRVTPQGMQENGGNIESYKCSLCETHFVTKQMLSGHIEIHHKERFCYPCPLCASFFPRPDFTYKHLSKAHHKTPQQIRQLRQKVLTKAQKRKLVDENQKVGVELERESLRLTTDAEGVLRCVGCGKLFNRQAVLRVHLTSCKERDVGKQSKPPEPPKKSETKPVVPRINHVSSYKPGQPKSGIIVRMVYNKKLNCGAKGLTPLTTNSIKGDHQSCKGKNLKRVNKWRTVLKKLHSQAGLDVSEKSEESSSVIAENQDS